jgi:hypothetical protein
METKASRKVNDGGHFGVGRRVAELDIGDFAAERLLRDIIAEARVVGGVALAVGLLEIRVEVDVGVEALDVRVELAMEVQDELLLIVTLVRRVCGGLWMSERRPLITGEG